MYFTVSLKQIRRFTGALEVLGHLSPRIQQLNNWRGTTLELFSKLNWGVLALTGKELEELKIFEELKSSIQNWEKRRRGRE